MNKVIKKSMKKKREVEAEETENNNGKPPCKRIKIVIKKKGLKMVSSSTYITKGRQPLGEDAHFIAAEMQTIGVADCVDAGELIKNSITAVGEEAKDLVDPRRVLQKALSKTNLQGASTACILTHNDGVLRATNVGDSGFMVFRDRKFLYKSPTQQCGFMEREVGVMEGDVVVVGTDGLLDNMFAWEIEKIVENEKEEVKPEDLARKIAKMAQYKSLKKDCKTPFERKCNLVGKKHKGGKLDDITVVVGKILPLYDLQLRT